MCSPTEATLLAECILPQISQNSQNFLLRLFSHRFHRFTQEFLLRLFSHRFHGFTQNFLLRLFSHRFHRFTQKFLLSVFSHRFHRIHRTSCRDCSPTDFTEFTELLAEIVLPQISQNYTDCLGAFKGVHLSQVHQRNKRYIYIARLVHLRQVHPLKLADSVNSVQSVGVTLLLRVCQNSQASRPEGAEAHSPGQRPG